MKKARPSARWTLLAPLSLALVLTTQPLSAQDAEACRCVDGDGNAIENCVCFRSPNVQSFARAFAPFSESRPRIGVSVDVGQSARHDARGARVTDLMEDGPAAGAGLEVGDVITSVDGKSLLNAVSCQAEDDFDLDVSLPIQRLLAISRGLEPGQEVEVEYLRDGDAHSAVVTADDLPTWGNTFTLRATPGADLEILGDRMRDLGDRLHT